MKIKRFEDIEAWQLACELIGQHEFNDVYEQARRTRAAVRGFINCLKKYKESKQKKP
jgi:hypothetical protein